MSPLTEHVEHKADEPVVLSERQKVGIDKDDVLFVEFMNVSIDRSQSSVRYGTMTLTLK